jgi:hypothetical protein
MSGKPPQPTAAQAAFLARLTAFAADPATPVSAAHVVASDLVQSYVAALYGGGIAIRLRLDTTMLPPRQGDGLRVARPHEDVYVLVPDVFPAVPPFVHVAHTRFTGTPHVLEGTRLCIYLDPSQEWHPTHTAVDFMYRLWEWLCDAVTGKFDPSTALFHPVGGVLHRTPGTPTVVARVPVPTHQAFGTMRVVARSDHRLDLRPDGEAGAEVLVMSVAGPMFRGAGRTLGGLQRALGAIGLPDTTGFGRLCKRSVRVVRPHPDAFLIRLGAAAARTPSGDPIWFLLAVPSGPGVGAKRHLICGRLPADAADRLRALVTDLGALAVPLCDVIAALPVEWCHVSEERPEMTMRRDRKTPVQSLLGAHVVVLGCGGLGSWIAEFVVRAGARRVDVRDNSEVTGGLLVRQDYTELDIGEKKAVALARRLDSLRDNIEVHVLPGNFTLGMPIPECDLLIDATVDQTAAAALAAAWPAAKHTPLVASVATDRATATLGLLTLTRPGSGPDPETAYALAGKAVQEREDLEPLASFWRSPEKDEELNPAPGCSVPTFHGSAADLAVVAGALTRLIAGHLPAPDVAGTHLVAMPHAEHTSGHVWLGHR